MTIVVWQTEETMKMGAVSQSMMKMEREGLIKLGSGKLSKNFWAMPRPDDPEGLVLKALLEERETGR
jgi:hypothetical protein